MNYLQVSEVDGSASRSPVTDQGASCTLYTLEPVGTLERHSTTVTAILPSYRRTRWVRLPPAAARCIHARACVDNGEDIKLALKIYSNFHLIQYKQE